MDESKQEFNEIRELNEGVGRGEGVVFLFKCGKKWKMGERVGGCGKEKVGFIKPRKKQGLTSYKLNNRS